jgi:hypothetical protein
VFGEQVGDGLIVSLGDIGGEYMIEGAVLSNNDDHVLDGSDGFGIVRSWSCHDGQGTKRQLRSNHQGTALSSDCPTDPRGTGTLVHIG